MKENEIKSKLVEYLRSGNPVFSNLDYQDIPFDKSLVELGYIDSFGVVDIVVFLEGTYSVKILDDEINKENFGSINKMVNLVLSKICLP